MGPSIGRSPFQPPRRPAQPSQRQRQQQPSSLPNGACCFRDLNLGHHAPTCGCRRFWLLKNGQDDGTGQGSIHSGGQIRSEGAWCFCGHHACFHEPEAVPRSPQLDETPDNTVRSRAAYSAQFMAPELLRNGQGSPSSTRSMRPSFGPGRDPQIARQEMTGSPAIYQESRSRQFTAHSTRLGLGLSLPGPNAFGNRASMFNPETQPAVDLPSTECDTDIASVSNVDETSHQRLVQSQPQVSIPQDRQNDEQIQSATEVNTPSNRGTPIFAEVDSAMKSIKAGLDDLNSGIAQSPCQSSENPKFTATQSSQQPRKVPLAQNVGHATVTGSDPSSVTHLIQQIASLRHLLSPSNLGNTFQTIHNRLDAIENISFAHGSMGDLSDRVELFDGRLIDVENKVEEIERALKYKVSRPSSSNEDRVDIGGLDPDLMTTNFVQRLGMLESRLHAIKQARKDSSEVGDTIEVILIPWGRALSGIWKPSSTVSATTPSKSGADANAFSSHANRSALMPALMSLRRGERHAYERLKSRGFVRKITPESDSALCMQQAIEMTFGDLLDDLNVTLPQTVDSSSIHLPLDILGLKSRFIPLRESISEINFLNATELANPASWNQDFLRSCATLRERKRTGKPRLFVTTPSAYFQHPSDEGVSWQMLREKPRYHPETPFSSFESGVGEGDAREPCWAFNVGLDKPCSVDSSYASRDGSAGDMHKGSFGSKASAQQVSPQPTEQASSLGEFEGVSDGNISLPFDFGDEADAATGTNATVSKMRPNDGENQFTRTQQPGGGHEQVAPITPLSEYQHPGILARHGSSSNRTWLNSREHRRANSRTTYSFSDFQSQPRSSPLIGPMGVSAKRHAASFDPSLLLTANQNQDCQASSIYQSAPSHQSRMQNRSISDPSSLLADQSKRRRVSSSGAPSISSLKGPGNNLTPRRSREPSHGLNFFAGQLELEEDAERAMQVDIEEREAKAAKSKRHERGIGTPPTAAAYATPFSAGPGPVAGPGSGSSGRGGTLKGSERSMSDGAMNWAADDSDDEMNESDYGGQVEEENDTSDSDSEVDREVMMQEEQVFTGVKDEDVDDAGVWGWEAEDDEDGEEQAVDNKPDVSVHGDEDDGSSSDPEQDAEDDNDDDEDLDVDGVGAGRYHFRPRGRASMNDVRMETTNDEISDVYVEDESSEEEDDEL